MPVAGFPTTTTGVPQFPKVRILIPERTVIIFVGFGVRIFL
jgi:hypothetical protein